MRILYPLANFKTALQNKLSVLSYTSIIRPLIYYDYPIWDAALSTKINKIQILQNKFIKICLKVLWFMRNFQIYKNSGIPLINTRTKNKFKNTHAELKYSERVRHYNLGRKTVNKVCGLDFLRIFS